MVSTSFDISKIYMQEYGSGRMLTGEIKARRSKVLTDLVTRHREARALVTEEVLNRPFWLFYSVQNCMCFIFDFFSSSRWLMLLWRFDAFRICLIKGFFGKCQV